MVAIIAGSVAGRSPIERSYSDSELVHFSRSRGRSNLETREGVEVHSTDEEKSQIFRP